MKSLIKRLACGIAALAMLGPAIAATTPNSWINPQGLRTGDVVFTSASAASSNVLLFTAGANGSRCNSFGATSSDPAGHNIQWSIYPSAGPSPSVQVAVALNANAGVLTPAQPLMSPALTPQFPVDEKGNMYFSLKATDVVYVLWNTNTITSVIGIHLECVDY